MDVNQILVYAGIVCPRQSISVCLLWPSLAVFCSLNQGTGLSPHLKTRDGYGTSLANRLYLLPHRHITVTVLDNMRGSPLCPPVLRRYFSRCEPPQS